MNVYFTFVGHEFPVYNHLFRRSILSFVEQEFDCVIVDEKNLETFVASIQSACDELQKQFPRCKRVNVKLYEAPSWVKTHKNILWSVEIEHVCKINLVVINSDLFSTIKLIQKGGEKC